MPRGKHSVKTVITIMITLTCLFALSILAFAEPITVTNPIVKQRADPWVYKHNDGYYYMTASVPEYDRIELRRATTLQGLSTATANTVWKRHASGIMAGHIWAPEIHFVNGKWYIYFSAGTSSNKFDIRLYALECSDANPVTGSWAEKGQIKTNWESFTLDATSFEHNGTRYLVWAQSDPKIAANSNVYIAKMNGPYSITGTQIMIATPQYAWEKIGYSVNEGPSVLKKNGKIFMTYSASATDSNYCVGLLTASDSSDLLNAGSWKKSPNPVFQTNAGTSQYGPGHNCFTTSQDETVDIMVYHARNYKNITGDPLYDPNRHMRAQRVNWNPDGTPNFGIPVADGVNVISTAAPTAMSTVTPTSNATPTPMLPSENPEDINGDYVINMSDIILMAAHFNATLYSGNYDKKYDINNDGVINMGDIIIVAKKFNKIIEKGTPVPTPTTLTPTPTKAVISLVPAKTVVRIESYNHEGYFLRHYDYIARFDLNPNSIYDSQFVERPGLADVNSVSFESVNFPGYYLRHYNYELKIVKDDNTNIFKQDATFKKVSGLADSSCVSYEAYNFPGMYIRNSNYLCKITSISTDSDRADATFNLKTQSNTFNNPRDTREQRPDPWVYKHTDGYYYGMHTVQRDGYIPEIIMYKSTSLSNLFTNGTNKIIWHAPATGWNNKDIWAPELYFIDNTWYIYYSANFRIGVLSNSSPDPMSGTWTDRGRISPDEWAIDGTILKQNGKMYMLWSGQYNGQVINITQMSSPTTLTGPTVRLSEPTYEWETHGLKVNEGPEILQRNGKTYCIYSASYCATQYYSLGMLTCSSTDDPMVRANWKKSATPLFQASAEDGLYGTGHCSFTKSKDGTEDWLVYHATIIPSNEYQARYVCIQQFTWNSDGTPNLGKPCGRKIPIPRPSGE
ncbi:family 43 glycosylhydrolase [Pseudobacteroides cellulosolvens]|uniref:Alpha-N-arabinofuranosidase n=1 Tax=Pseudobacteroides cellulosolvens ATCC 35603 = DSM 2933 TaxID=398512 RepID=A0A0L6JUZ3_9FIRM|nr:family 43 glycosylhydrolase [Pseudobacteroides cellulosolvens]KNY29222.1 Alpha-N-arabinofuranosidase [Pseudobacteroides cellulosolvens ATCC 35603 = DSM 2933]